jgi:hypothetical protein
VCEPECPVDAIKPDTEPGLFGQTSRGRSLHHPMQTPLWMCPTSLPNTSALIPVKATRPVLHWSQVCK